MHLLHLPNNRILMTWVSSLPDVCSRRSISSLRARALRSSWSRLRHSPIVIVQPCRNTASAIHTSSGQSRIVDDFICSCQKTRFILNPLCHSTRRCAALSASDCRVICTGTQLSSAVNLRRSEASVRGTPQLVIPSFQAPQIIHDSTMSRSFVKTIYTNIPYV